MKSVRNGIVIAFYIATSMFALSNTAVAGLILQKEAGQAQTFVEGSIWSQSFTAEDSQILSIGFALSPGTRSSGGTFTVTLLDGEGLTGPVIRTSTRSISSLPPLTFANPQIFDFDFSGVHLVVGDHYTAWVSGTNPTTGLYSSGYLGDLYPGGIFYGDVGTSSQDATFRVVPAPVPEPSSIALVGIAVLAALGWRLRSLARCPIL